MEKPKNLHHLNSFQTAVNIGKRIARVTSDSIAGKRLMGTKGSILAENELLVKFEALKAKENRPKHGGAKGSSC